MTTGLRLSLAIPVHNEEEVLPELLRRVAAVLDQVPGGPHEIVFVDDGSTDRSLAILEEAAQRDPRIVVLSFSRNFGHQAAISAAVDHVSGDAVVIMDSDLQDTPESVPVLLEKYFQGYDVVFAQRVNRKESWWLRACYFAFYRLVRALSDIALPLDSGDFGLMSRRVIDRIRSLPEHHRYMRGLRTWVGYRQTGVPITRMERHSGHTKYTPLKLLKLASDGIFAFSTVPLRAATVIGMCGIASALLYAIYSLFAKYLLGQSPPGFTALTILVTMLSGFILFFLGIIGEYVGRIYEEVKARPNYIVGRVIRSERTPSAADGSAPFSTRSG
ncbi:MAG TPA: glycosyltransferase family 2 protein [Candidatus Polarisedimenticolia bacterium]|jgi:dolichol-phosphate mannosyltransferase|nr:glycosyltransferase family 2 protein [Candidatus Polarisedimenticolia bacterium]